MEFEEVENIRQRIKEIRKSKSITIQKRYTAVLGAASIRGGRSHSGRQDGGQSGWNGLSLRTGRFDLYQAESLSHDAECGRYSLPLLLASADYG